MNAYAERFVHSIKSECLAKVIPLGEAQLHKVVTEYTQLCHLEHNHQGLDSQLIGRGRVGLWGERAVLCRRRFGGTLYYYFRGAT